jgi:tRNA(fMet)-specific endonuclease VapC
MLDTDIVSDLVRHPHGRVATKVIQHGADTVCISVISSAELLYGALRTGSARLLDRVENVLANVHILPFDRPCDLEYGKVRSELEAAGQPIGPNDTLIAAHARSLSLTIVTANTSEFARVRGLHVENWLA